MSEQYPDLGITQNQDGDYWDVVIPDLDFDTSYALQAGWMYSDKALGVSELSDRFIFTTISEPAILAPHFIATDLDAINSILYIKWDGLSSGLVPYDSAILKKVNVWIKGGDYGEAYKQVHSFTESGLHQINATQKTTYCVKLQAESKQDNFSAFSSEFCVTLLEQPNPVFEVRHEWVKRDLVLFWKFDVALPKNSLSDSFSVQLIANGKEITLYTNVDRTKIPPLEHKIVFIEARLAAIFGQVTAFQTDYDAFIYVRDTSLQTSTVVGYDVSSFVDPLAPPVISVIKGPLSYNVSFTNNSEFDRVFIEDSIDSGVTWVDRGSSSSNPVYVSSLNSAPRQVRARFSRVRGGLTGYSNIVTVTPDPLVSFNDEAPNKPTSFSGLGSVDASGVIGFNGVINFTWTPDASSSNVRGYRIRFRPYKETAPFEEFSYVDSPGTGTKYRLSGLAVGATYEIAVGSFNEFNKESVSYTSATNVLVPGTPFIGTNVTTTGYFQAFPGSGNISNAFRFGYGVESGKRGITFNENNYWYIDSDASALFKLGGDAENYIQWTGQAFIIQGDLRAKKGNFSGGVEIISGGSLFSGVMNANQSNIIGSGFMLNNTGLKFSSSTVPDITTISGTTGRLVTKSAEIGGWIVSQTAISSSGITLTSGSTPGATSIVAGNAGGYVGIKPKGTDGSDIVLWAGTTATPQANIAASGQAGFQVNADGQLYATDAIIQGKIIANSGSSLGGLLGDTSKIYAQNDEPAGGTYKTGDAWVDTNDSNKLYVYNSAIAVPASKWVLAQDSESARTIANLKNKTHFVGGTTSPTGVTGAVSGDLWINSSNKNKPYRYNGSAWEPISDQDLATAIADAQSALAKAVKFGVDGALTDNLAVRINDGAAGSIHSSYKDTSTNLIVAKSSYASTEPGFFLGWELSGTVIYPAINIGNAERYLKYSNSNGVLEIKGTIKATSGAFEGNVTAGAGAITIGPAGISANGFSINTSGAATFTGGTFSGNITATGGTITGGTITTSGNFNGSLRMNSSNNQLEWIGNSDAVIGRAFVFAGNQTIIASGAGGTYNAYPTSAGMINLSNQSVSMQVTNSAGTSIGGLTVDSTNALFTGVNVQSQQGASLTSPGVGTAGQPIGYVRNIGMGPGVKTTADTDGVRGDIWIQYA